MEFNIEKELAKWRKQLKKEEGLEPGHIEELESNLLDRFDDLVAEGMNEPEAFQTAKEKCFSDATEVADEFYRSRSPIVDRTPPWRRSSTLINLIPNYLKIALRNIQRKKGYSLINFLGLIIGLTVLCFVGLYVQYELTWDSFHSKSDRIVRLGNIFRSQEYSLISFRDWNETERDIQLIQAEGLKNTIGVEDIAQFWVFGDKSFVKVDENRLIVEDILRTNTPAAFFNLFDWKFIQGNSSMFSSSLNKTVLTEDKAKHFFGEDWRGQDILGQEITIDSTNYQIAGVIENIPANSHFEFSMALHSSRIPYWGARTYALLEEGAVPSEVLQRWLDKMPSINENLAGNREHFGGFVLRGLEDLHLEANALYELKPKGNVIYLVAFGIVGLIILLITLTNYTNLAIVMYTSRNREIAMRKVMGARRVQIIGQFLTESVFLSLISIPFTLLLLGWLLPHFNEFMGVQIVMPLTSIASYIILLVLIALGLGLMAGIYPAIILSGKGIQSLFRKGADNTSSGYFNLRNGLIGFQFALLIGLGSVTYIVNQQLDYIRTKELGFNTTGVVYVEVAYSENFPRFKNELLTQPGVNEVGSGSPLGITPFNQITYKIEGDDDVFDDAYSLYMSPEAVNVYGISTTRSDLFADTSGFPNIALFINQSAADQYSKILGIGKNELIGKVITTEPEYTQEDGTIGFPRQIEGFFEDINLFSLKEKIDPYFVHVIPNYVGHWASVNFDISQTESVLASINEAYQLLDREAPINILFQDEMLYSLYEQDRRIGALSTYLCILAFIVAILGLVGLTAFLTTQRKKEIGIRKVLGASDTEIIKLFNKDYILVIILALVVIAPVAYFAINVWLSGFAFRISTNPIIFLAMALLTFGITVTVVSMQVRRIAGTNPVQSIRNDQ